MRSPVVLALSLLFGVTLSQESSPLRGFGWRASLAEVSLAYRIRFEASEGPVRRYLCLLDSLGSTEIQDCRLEFIRDRLSGIAVTTRGRRNSETLLKDLRRRYGEGTPGEEGSIQWSRGGTRISYDPDSAGDACIYWYRTDALWEE